MGVDLKINDNIEQTKIESKKSRFRDVFAKIVASRSKISSISMDDDEGDITFYVPIKDSGLDQSDLIKYRNEIFSNFVVDFMGELFIRENLEVFVKLMSNINNDNYHSVIGKCEHKCFGMRSERGCFIFSFHISFLQNILTEDFKHKVKR